MRFILLATLFVLGCDPDPVGRKCDLGTEPGDTETVISTASLDCTSRTCLQVAGADDALCTAPCATDDDCIGDPITPCETGFTCTAVVEVGPFANEPMCVCRDDLANR